jgi:dTDP-4-amino-4,6-dideoxygalactose transaminase
MNKTAINIQMVDLKGQYRHIREEVDAAVLEVIRSAAFVNGPAVKQFQAHMEDYLKVKHVIPCANGTDALQIALMACGLEPGDEVVVPAFTYVSSAEVIALLGLKPVMVDVDPDTFNVTADIIAEALTPRTRAVIPVNLFGQSCDLEPILALARARDLYVIEDNAQAIGADYTFADGHRQKTGTVGHIGCTSFYPSKNLGAYGDGGALYTDDDELAQACRLICNHGQNKRYYHARVGVNSRLNSIQAAILDIKLGHLDAYAAARRRAADYYDAAFSDVDELQTPVRHPRSTHVFHQYTLILKAGDRNALQAHLSERQIPSMIYYPVALHHQEAFKEAMANPGTPLPHTEYLCDRVISLPMHTELDEDALAYIAEGVRAFFK